MKAHGVPFVFCLAVMTATPGCLLAPRTELNSAQTQNRALTEQNRAQLTEIENLKAHNHDVENRLIRSEEHLALLQEKAGLDQKQIETYCREREGLYEQFKGVACGRGRVPPELSRQFADLSRRYPSLQFDPETGVSKLDTDILFDSGAADLKPSAAQAIDEFARVLKAPAAVDLKILVVGHADNQQIVGKPTRDKHPNNLHLSSARALAVADRMKQAGLPETRITVAGFGLNQPAAANATAMDRHKNRRVEIFVAAADVPMVGCVTSTPNVY